MRTIDLLKNHRSIRKFSEKSIAPDLLENILLAGQAAATSSFVQAYSLIRVTDSQLREQLAICSGNQGYINHCAEFFVCCADQARNKAICRSDDLEPDTGYTEQLIVATVDAALMAQNMVIAAESEGLGTCYIGGIRNNPEKVTELLKLPAHVYPVFGLCLGYPNHNPETKPRMPLSLWVKENTYSEQGSNSALHDYDQKVSAYFKSRTSNRKSDTWSQQLKQVFSKETRPALLDYLRSQGFAKH